MGTVTDGVLVLMVGFSKGYTIIGKHPVSIVIFFTFGGCYGFEKSRVANENNFVAIFGRFEMGGVSRPNSYAFKTKC